MKLENIELIKEFYIQFKAKNKSAYLQLCDDQIEWNAMESMPNGGKRIGKAAVFDEYFPVMLSNFDGFHAIADEFIDADNDTVLVLGKYSLRSKYTHQDFEAQFAHVYTVKNGKITRFRQYTDTAKIQQALAK